MRTYKLSDFDDMNIQFISYNGEYPSYCCGTLVLRVNGETRCFSRGNSFWSSGGCCYYDDDGYERVDEAPWVLVENKLPADLRPFADEIAELFNRNVEPGCCGGCI